MTTGKILGVGVGCLLCCCICLTPGGESKQLPRKRQRAVKERLSQEEGAPSRLRLRELQSGDLPEELVPTARQIGRYRSERQFADRLRHACTQSELKDFLTSLAPSTDKTPGALWVDPDATTISAERILIPMTCDYCLKSLSRLAAKGQEVYGRKRCLKLVGDATHNKSREKLKVRMHLGART